MPVAGLTMSSGKRRVSSGSRVRPLSIPRSSERRTLQHFPQRVHLNSAVSDMLGDSQLRC